MTDLKELRPFGSKPCRGAIALVATASLLGCGSGPGSIAPAGMHPAEPSLVTGWTDAFTPPHHRQYDIRPWRFRNERGAAAGRATLRIAPPDSLRFDYRGPFRRQGRAALVADSTLWVEPEEEFGGLVGSAPLFWAAVGVPLPPPEGRPILVLERNDVRAWQYADGTDTLTFVIRGRPPRRIHAEVRRQGRTVSRTQVELDPATGFVVHSQIDFPGQVSRFEFTIEQVDTTASFPKDIWENR
jgi:hypothetical protein